MSLSAELPLLRVARWLVGVHPVPLLLAPTSEGTACPGDVLQTGVDKPNLLPREVTLVPPRVGGWKLLQIQRS